MERESHFRDSRSDSAKVRIRCIAVLMLGAAFLASGCSEERPLKPEPTEIRIYVGAIDHSRPGPARSLMFVFDYDSLAVIDSFPLPAPSVDAVAGNDGRSLFVVTANDLRTRSIWKYDVTTYEPLWHVDLDRWVETPDGNGRIRSYGSGRQLLFNRTLIDASTGDVIKTFPDEEVAFGGSPAGTRIVVGTEIIPRTGGTPRVLHGYDLQADTTWGQYAPHLTSGAPLSTYTAELAGDGRQVLAIGPWRDLADSWFVIGDLITGQTLLEYPLIYPFGEIAISADGSRAVVADPSRTLIYDSYPTVDVFDLTKLSHLKRFTAEADSLGFFGQIALTPSTDEVFIAPPGDFNSFYVGVLALELSTLQVSKFFQLPGQSQEFAYSMGGLAIGLVIPSHSVQLTKADRSSP